MIENSENKMSRRRALMRVGLLSLGAYSVPAVTALSYAVTVSEPNTAPSSSAPEPSTPERTRNQRQDRGHSGPSSPRRAGRSSDGCGDVNGLGCAAGSE